MRTIRATAALIAATLALAACSNAGADAEPPTQNAGATSSAATEPSSSTAGAAGESSDASSSQASAGDASGPSTAPSSSTSPAEENDQGIAWVPFGPATSGVPVPQADTYGQLYTHECRGPARSDLLENQKHVYEGALAACRAVATNAADDWAAAEHELGQVADPGALECLDSQAFQLLQQLVSAHKSRPGTAPTIRPATRATACPTKITSVVFDDESGKVKVVGEHLWGVSSATVGGKPASGVETQIDAVLLTPAAPLAPGSKVPVVLVQGALPPQTATLTVPGTPPPSAGGGASS